jgi:apolipoprotein D and lipocalin family protein
MFRTLVRSTVVITGLLLLVACASKPPAPLPTLPKIDLERFAGRWHIHANMPYFPERGKVGSFVEYKLRPDGRIDDLYFFRKETLDAELESWEGIATVLDPATNARLKAQFIWPFSTEFVIAEVDPDYQTALVVTPDRKLAWIYGREPVLPEATRSALEQRLSEIGVDLSTMVRIPQRAE